MVQYQHWRYIHPWERIERGDSEQHVLETDGTPRPCPLRAQRREHMGVSAQDRGLSCRVGEAVSVILFSITGEEYRIGFDSSGRAVSKFHITSP